jgi:P-type Ca2+ transporter type 2C
MPTNTPERSVLRAYQQDSSDVLRGLGTSEQGLSSPEVQKRLVEHGPNRLGEEDRISKMRILVGQFTSPLIYILLIAAVVTALLEEYTDSGVILAVVFLNAAIGFFQEYRAEESVRALKKLVVPKARVVRDGREQEIDSADLVPGDIVLLASGVKVPADIRLVKALELKTDESMLTGESLPSQKTLAAIAEPNLPPGDQRNMAFLGTVVVNGRGRGVVVATGARSVLGSIAREMREAETAPAPLQQKFHRFSAMIGYVVLAASCLLFGIGLLVGETVKDMFMTAVAAAVATIPEGLPAVLTIALALGVRNMARRNAIVRKLPAVETLGSTTVICTDKTGTLTKNEMTVKVVHDGEHVFEVTGTGYDPAGEVLHGWLPITEQERKDLFLNLRIGLLCNESEVYEKDGAYRVDGDPTEGALIVSAMKAGLRPEEEKRDWPLVSMVPFESDRGYMATLHRHNGKKYIFVKGGPERVLELCTACHLAGALRAKEVLDTAHRFASEGMRVLAMAYKEAPPDLEELTHEHVEGNILLTGLQGMIDPPRPEAVDAVKGCRKAGIRVVMITGDHATTAAAIGRMIGIGDGSGAALTGRELEEMGDDELFERVRTVSIFARVAPHHKLRIARQLIRHGEIVAMTGDGVNDAPALKAAHIGVAMGRTGTDVAKEAADMVIIDDNFATIFAAVEEGRIVFDNIRKVVFFLIPTGLAAVLSIIGTIALGLPMPYTPSQLLWINLVTNGLQVLALTFEPGEPGVVLRPPRDPREGVMSAVLVQRTVLVGALIAAGVVWSFHHALAIGEHLEQARTIAVTTMVFFQFFQTWNSRSETQSVFRIGLLSNPLLLFAIAASVLAQLAMIYVPVLQWIFKTEPLTVHEWARVFLLSLTVVLVVEIDKWLRRRREHA